MMRSVVIHGVILVGLLGAAWARYTAEDVGDEKGEVAVLHGDAEDIETIRWQSEDDEAILERRSDEHGAYLWVTYTKWEEAKVEAPPETLVEQGPAEAPVAEAGSEDSEDSEATAGAADEGGAQPNEAVDAPERVPSKRVFKAGQTGLDLLEDLSPLMAVRRLSDVDSAKLADIGLEDATSSVEIVRKGRTRTLEIGGEAYGTRDRYARDPESGDIYLIDDEVLRPLKYARTRLPDRTLFSVEKETITSVRIAGLEQALDVVQLHAEDAAKATWALANAPTEGDEQLKTWMDKALKLKGSSYADPESPPEGLEPRFQLVVQAAGGVEEILDVQQEADNGDWYGQSPHTRGWVKLLRGPTNSLWDDVGSLTP